MWPCIVRDQTMLWILKLTRYYSQLRAETIEILFQLSSIEEMTFQINLNNSWFGMYFQRGTRFGLWSNVPIMTEFWCHKLCSECKENRLIPNVRDRAHMQFWLQSTEVFSIWVTASQLTYLLIYQWMTQAFHQIAKVNLRLKHI